MINPEQSVLDTIAELEAEENPDDITDLVRWQLKQGMERGDHEPETVEVPLFPPDRDLDEILADLDRLRGLMRRMAPEPSPDAPYQEFRKLEPGERVGWTGPDGTVFVGVVKEHVEDPPGSGNWTLELADESG